MQTILENLEETYLHLQSTYEDDQKGLINLDSENREDVYISFCNTIRCIIDILTHYTEEVEPMDKRVYPSLIKTPTFTEMHEERQKFLINILYDKGVLVREMTIKELIEKLQDYDDTCTLTVDGHKFVVDDTVFGSRLDLKVVKEGY